MKLLVEPLGGGRRVALVGLAAAFMVLALLAITSRAQASETLYWDNYGATPTTIAFANIDGTGGGGLSLSSAEEPGTDVEISNPEGLAYDPANGRIYVANAGDDTIAWVSTDGSGAGVLDTGAAPVEDPEGIAVDPSTQTVYWANSEENGSIGYASANGGGGGSLNTGAASVDVPYRIALDTVSGRVYWIDADGIVSYANLNGTGGAELPLPEGEQAGQWSGINVDPATNRLYILGAPKEGVEGIYWVSIVGLGGGEIELEGSAYDSPYGLAFDPSLDRFYWGNYGADEEREFAIGTTTSAGQLAAISVTTAPVSGPQDPVIVKSPVAEGMPKVAASGAGLSCSRGEWQPDYPGSNVYAAPLTYAYQWSKDGQAIAGANHPSYTATASGSYACTVTATNRSGAASQTSTGTTVVVEGPKPVEPVEPAKPASLSLRRASKKPVKVTAGKVAVVKVVLVNGGGTASGPVKVCAKLNKRAKKGLVGPKCVSVTSVPAGKTVVAKLRVKTRAAAKGTYKFAVVLKGASAKSMTAKVQVIAPKVKQHKK